VLLIDLDPQGHLSLYLGIDGSTVGRTVYDLFLDESCPVEDVIVRARPNLDCLPSTVDLAAAESELAGHPARHRILVDRLAGIIDRYDFVLIDCPPSLGLLTLNALAMAGEVVVPMQAQFLAMQGLSKLLETVAIVARGVNATLKVGGVVLCMHESQSTHGKEVVGELDRFFEAARGSGQPWDGASVFRPAIRRNVKLAESPSFGQTIFDYAPWCPGALDYRTLAERFVRDWERRHGAPDRPLKAPPVQPTVEVDRQAVEELRSGTLVAAPMVRRAVPEPAPEAV
jgi:chromosome partitioning protein